MNTKQYFKMLQEEVNKQIEIANKARAIGIDPVDKVEVPIAMTLAEKAVGLISTRYPQLDDKVVKQIAIYEKEFGALEATVAFKIAEDIAKEKFCKFESLLQAIDAGIRVGFSYITLGVVSSPLEGFTELKLGQTRDGKEYFKVYFSGPIRSAGTTATCMVLMLIDYLRETFGYAKYDPNEEEVRRYVTENYDYHERVTNLQYLPTEGEIEFLSKNIPIQIAGEPTEQREVSNYKDLERVETNFIRGGMCLAFSEGLAQKAKKGFRLYNRAKDNGVKVSGFDFLGEYLEKFAKKAVSGKKDSKPVYMRDLVAGRPFFGNPSRQGTFRLRYGRTRVNGFSANAVHPGTMAITDNFISYGTQLKIEKPTKGCIVGVCDKIDGPIVKLKDGSIKRVKTHEEGMELYPKTSEIIHLGDLLIPAGDTILSNSQMMKPGYVEEWWKLQLADANPEYAELLDPYNINLDQAIQISKEKSVPLHPKFIYYWTELDKQQLFGLIDWLSRGRGVESKLILPWTPSDQERFKVGKRSLELIGVPHDIETENITIEGEDARALLINLGVKLENKLEDQFTSVSEKVKSSDKEILEVINELSEFQIKDKAGTYIGSRMGKPEKAKLRKLTGSPHAMFPVGEEGGRLRSFQAAHEVGEVKAEFPLFHCPKCGREELYPKCLDCKVPCTKRYYSRKDDKAYDDKGKEEENRVPYFERRIDIRKYYDDAKKVLKISADEIPIVKGVRGTSNAEHEVENLGKGMLRAKYNLNVNKDGTIRYDMQEAPITHFKPKEVGTSIEKLKELGYEKDVLGNPLENDDQVLEMFPHDVILPACPETLDEKADDVFYKIGQFVDDELQNLYKQEPYFKMESKKDITGALVTCIAPHICTTTVGRIIGFSKTQTLLASPFMHAAMRRDCDGDEAAAMLLMDMLLNFSRKYLPAHRGGTQDAPLVLNTEIRAGDVDDQILDFEVGKYPLKFYEDAEAGVHSSEIKGIEFVKDRLREGTDPFTNIQYTHECSDINAGAINSSYKTLPTMDEKVGAMMNFCVKNRSVDTREIAALMIDRHFIRDTKGNLRKFSQQGFRCVGCNEKYRRIPLQGKCEKCGGKLIFTIAEGSVLKYMQKALDLARKYDVDQYLLENLELTEMYIHSIFGKEKEKQEALNEWF